MNDMAETQHSTPEASVYEVKDAAKVRKLRQKRATQKRHLLKWIDEHFQRDIDFGQIHVASRRVCQTPASCSDPYHFSKPILMKPGAEKIQHYFGLKAFFPGAREYEKAALSGVAVREVILVCEIFDAEGQFICQGLGSCSVEERGGRMNEALKMAKKRSFVDAIISATGLSQHFTQDEHDANVNGELRGRDADRGQANEEPRARRRRQPERPVKTVGKKKLETLEKRIRETGIPVKKFCHAFGIQAVNELPDSKFGRAMDKLKVYEKTAKARKRQSESGPATDAAAGPATTSGSGRSGNAATANC